MAANVNLGTHQMLVSGWGPALNKCFNPERCIHGGLLICSPIS